jgi:SET domain-containing protein
MLKVKTKIGNSNIHGVGLFADEFIAKGTKIWEFSKDQDRVLDEEGLNNLNDLDKNFWNIYAFKFKGLYYLCVDNSRFYNHSLEPNCGEDNELNITYAAIDILQGQELTTNYNNFGTIEDNIFNLKM